MYICGSRNIVTRAIQKVVVSLFPLLMLDAVVGMNVDSKKRKAAPSQAAQPSGDNKNRAILSVAQDLDRRLRIVEGNLYTTFLMEPSNTVGVCMSNTNEGYWSAKPAKGVPHPSGHVKNVVMAALVKWMVDNQNNQAFLEELKIHQEVENMKALVTWASTCKDLKTMDPEVDWASAKISKDTKSIVVKIMIPSTSMFRKYWGTIMVALRLEKGMEAHGAPLPGPQIKQLAKVLGGK